MMHTAMAVHGVARRRGDVQRNSDACLSLAKEMQRKSTVLISYGMARPHRAP